MPEQGRYASLPRPESTAKLVEYLSSSNAVTHVEQESEQIIHVKRRKRPPLRVYLTNIYILGVADIHDIFVQGGDLNAIVTMSAWNGFTLEAKNFCNERGVGLFSFKWFLGALHYDGEKFLNYIHPEELERRRRSSSGR